MLDKTEMINLSPVRLLSIVVVSIFTVEMLIMLSIPFLPPLSDGIHAVLDSTILVILTFPAIYFFSFRPMVRHIAKAKQAEADLHNLLDELGIRVQERTDKLVKTNQAIQMEINGRKLVEAALHRSETRLANILDNAAEAIIAMDEEQNIILFNKGAEKIFGYLAGEVIGQPLDILLPAKFADFHRQKVSALSGSSPISRSMETRGEVIGRRKDGSEFPAQVGISTYREKGKVIYTAVMMDITERKLAEEQIHHNAARTQALADISQTIVEAGLDLQAIIDDVSRQVTELTGDICDISLLLDDGQQLHLASLNQPQSEIRELIPEMMTAAHNLIGEGWQRQVAQTGQPLRIDKVSLDEKNPMIQPTYPDALEKNEVNSILIVPMRDQGRVIGTLSVMRIQNGCPYTTDDQSFLQDIADRTSLAVVNAQLYDKAQSNLRKFQTLRQIDIAITESVDLQTSLATILDQVILSMEVDAASVLILSPGSLTLDFIANRGFRTNALQHTHLRLGESYAGRAALQRRIISIPDLRERQTDFLRSPTFISEGFVSYFGVPLVAKNQVKGVLEIFHRSRLDPGAEWLDFLEALASQAAIAIDNGSLFEDLQISNQELFMAYDETIEGWSYALDLRDKETEGHTRRVTEMTLRLARAMGVREAELPHVRWGALLHDIGKMGIPDHILLKPGSLTDEEWVLMRKHPVYAYDMLSQIAYLKPALEIPYCHHEKWDGTGYPRGLKGEEIPLVARIFAVADVWDALCSNRPYRPAWPEEKVKTYIQEQAGKHFDPEVINMFLRMIDKDWRGMSRG